MPQFKVNANGKSYMLTAPDQATAIAAFQKFSGAQPAKQYPTNAQGEIDRGNPMAQGAPSAPDPNAPPLLDQLSAGFTSGLNAIPIAGPSVLGGMERLKGLVQGRSYEDVAKTDQAQVQQNPVASGIGSVAGTVLPFMAGGELPVIGKALGMTGSLPSRIGFGMASGGVINGADTAMRGGSPMDVLTSAGTGTALGGTLPMVERGIGMLAGKVIGRPGIPKAAQNVYRAMRDDGITPANVNQNIAQLGNGAMLMDLGPNLQRQAGALASVRGPGQTVVRKAVDTRALGASDRVINDVAQTIGAAPDLEAMKSQIVTAQKAAATPLYDAVRDVPVPMTGNIKFVSQTPMGKQAFAQALTAAKNDGYGYQGRFASMDEGDKNGLEWSWNRSPDSGMAAARFGDRIYAAKTHQEAIQKAVAAEGDSARALLDANPSAHLGYQMGGTTIGLIDYAKQALDDTAKAAARQGKDNVARQAGNMAKLLRNEADKIAPGYKAARAAFAGPAQVLDAVDAGTTVFSKGTTPTQLSSSLNSMTPSEKDAFIQGARSFVESQMGNAVNDALSLRNMFKKDWNEQKLRLILGPKIADDLMARISREATFGKTSNVVAGNSESAARLAAQPEVAPELGQTPKLSVTWTGLVLSAFDKARNAIHGIHQPMVNSQMAGALTGNSVPPQLLKQIVAASRTNRPSMIAPAVPALLGKPKPLQITVNGGAN